MTNSADFGVFDFGLDPEQEVRASRLHRESIVIDALFQGPVGFRSYDEEMNRHLRSCLVAPRDRFSGLYDGIELPVRLGVEGRLDSVKEHWDASGITCGNREIELVGDELRDRTVGFAQMQFDRFEWLTKALTASDIRQAHAMGTHAGLVSSQVMAGPWDDLDALAAFHDFGMRMCQLTYNELSRVGAGCTAPTDEGLSPYGLDSVKVMNQLGVIIDTAHTGRRSTLDACAASAAPVVASHSAAQGIYMHARGKSDDEIRAIAQTGGVIGIVAVPFFLGTGDRVDINVMLNHIEYVAEVAGIDHVCIGTDWPMQLPEWMSSELLQPLVSTIGFRPEDGVIATARLIGFDDYRDFPNITRGLVSRGWSDLDICKVLGENFLRVMDVVCG